MNSIECSHEHRIVKAVLSGAWPAGDEELVAHAAQCGICREVAEVAVLLRADHDRARGEVQVPVAGQVWWRSAVRARLESTEAAIRPMTWLHGVTAAVALGIMLAVIGVAWPSLVESAGWARETIAPLIFHAEIPGVVGGVLRQTMVIAAVAALCLVIAPVLLYLVLSSD